MELLDYIDELDAKIERAKNIFLINRALFDKEDLHESIAEIRLRLPEDLKHAKWVKDERKRILADAQAEAESIIKSAEEKTVQMVNEHEVTKKAYEQANEIIAAAQKNARELRLGARQYVDSLLGEMDDNLGKAQDTIRQARSSMRGGQSNQDEA